VLLRIVLYRWSNPSIHSGSFFGNAIADWTGVFVTLVTKKFRLEKGLRREQAAEGAIGVGGHGVTAQALSPFFSQ
jgi:hypothetical protein